jgi:hypothetical protein
VAGTSSGSTSIPSHDVTVALHSLTSTQAHLRERAGVIVEYFCDECQRPCEWTDRGSLCDEHYVTVCEHCGLRPAAALHNGYFSCGRCISEGRN